MVSLDDLSDEDVNGLATVFEITSKGKIVPDELFKQLSRDALQYYVDKMEEIRLRYFEDD